MLIKYVFIVSACILALMIMFFKLYLQKQKHSYKTVQYTHIMIWVFALYILSAFLMVFFVNGIFNKLMTLLFAVSPFVIGKFATYEKETVYSYIQIFCAILSAGYLCIVVL